MSPWRESRDLNELVARSDQLMARLRETADQLERFVVALNESTARQEDQEGHRDGR